MINDFFFDYKISVDKTFSSYDGLSDDGNVSRDKRFPSSFKGAMSLNKKEEGNSHYS